ncbi:hypothetical protein FI667_g16030, partial [Globisporangium splendens]
MPHRKTSILSNASSTATSDKVKFPLQDDEIPRVTLTPEQIKQYRDSAYDVIRITLEAEIQFRYRDMAMMNPHDWKFLKSMERMKVYKRITPGEDLPSMVIGVGFIDGMMEDAFYGLHHKTTEEMRKTTTYVNKDMLDSAVIANLEMGTDADPFRYLGLKWRVAKTPMGNIIKNRDVCNMECMGIDTDEQGIKYGYLLLKSVDVPGFPVYPESMVVRAQMMLCCIYRQITPNVLAFYSKGVFNLCGDLADFMAFNTSADMVLNRRGEIPENDQERSQQPRLDRQHARTRAQAVGVPLLAVPAQAVVTECQVQTLPTLWRGGLLQVLSETTLDGAAAQLPHRVLQELRDEVERVPRGPTRPVPDHQRELLAAAIAVLRINESNQQH